jgi:Domain of unknown function (DUF222)
MLEVAVVGSLFDRATQHPVLACAEALEAALTDCAEVPVVFMDAAAKREALLGLVRVEARLAALRLRLMAAGEDVAAVEGARDVAALLTHHTRTGAGANRRDLALATALDRRWTGVGAALGRGDLNVAQARVITHALEELPRGEVSAELLARAEAHLVAQAGEFGPRELRVLGRRILEILAPEVFEAHEAQQLAEEERRAWLRTRLASTRLGEGTTRITLHVPDALAIRLHTYLEAYTSGTMTPPTREQGRPTGSRSTADAARRSAP